MTTNDLNARVKEALERTDIMALSTIGEDGSWTSPVQFTYDKNLNLYFLSMPNAKHVKNILKNTQISVAIYKDEPFKEGGNLGLQIKGTAELESKEGTWQRFKITPVEVWCFDSRVKMEREKIDLRKFVLP